MRKTFSSMFLALCVSMVVLFSACAPASTPILPEPPAATLPETAANTGPLTIAEAEGLAGFDVREPAYLPVGVSFDSVTFQDQPSPSVTLHYQMVHEQFGDMGSFFQILQEPQTEVPADTLSCGESVDGCEVLQIDGVTVVYRLNPAGPEGLNWYRNGIAFRLLRTAGEPDKVYKDELIQVLESME